MSLRFHVCELDMLTVPTMWNFSEKTMMRHRTVKLRLASHGICLLLPAAYSTPSHGGTLWGPTRPLAPLAGTSPG